MKEVFGDLLTRQVNAHTSFVKIVLAGGGLSVARLNQWLV